MRVNTWLPESVPHVISHLETRITDTSFIQNNIKSGSPDMCSNIRPESAYTHTVYNRIHHQRTTKSSFYITRVQNLILQVQHRKVQTNLHYKPWAHRTESILYRKLKIIIFTCSHGVLLRRKNYDDGVLLKGTIPASSTYSSPAPGSAG